MVSGKTTRKAIRESFKAIDYRVSFPRNPLNNSLCNIAFQSTEMLKPCVIFGGSVYGSEFRATHKQAFDLANTFRGLWLEDTAQKIS